MVDNDFNRQKIVLNFSFDKDKPPSPFRFQLENVRPEPLQYQDDRCLIMLFGSPIIGNSIDRQYVLKKILSDGLKDSFLKSINGEFLLVVFYKNENKLVVVNDRFASFPLYYSVFHNEFIGSFSYYDLWKQLKESDRLNFTGESFFQLLSMRRLFGESTHDESSFFLPPATKLEYDGKKLNHVRYWTPSYAKRNVSLSESSEGLAECIKQSVSRKTSDACRSGLFLSGGMDTRMILSAFSVPPACFTATMNRDGNREYLMAKKAAEQKGSEHTHLQLDEDHYEKIYDASIRLGGAMYEPNAIFMGYRDVVSKKADCLFHGHGLDYMFQGMYLPIRNRKLFSRDLKAKCIRPLGVDIANEYIDTISFRLKYKELYDCFCEGHKAPLKNYLYNCISGVLDEGRNYTENPYDLWGYLSFHALSRHYSYPDHASIHLNGEQRTITFDNDVYDFFLSLPVQHRLDAKAQRAALAKLDPALSKIPSANDGLPFSSSNRKTMYQMRDALLTRCKLKKREVCTHLQRTWPTHKWLIDEMDFFRDMALNLSESSPVAQLKFLDMKKINSNIHAALSGNSELSKNNYFYDFVWNLMGINRFFEL